VKNHNKSLASLSRRLDPIWWLIARILGLARQDANQGTPQTILLVDLHLLGDMVMLVPLLRVIRRYHPNALIGLMAGPWAREILSDEGLVDEFITLRAPWNIRGQGARGITGVVRAVRASRERQWDWGIDVRGDARNILLLALARAKRRVAFDFTGGAALLTDVVPDDGVIRHIIEHHAALARHLGMTMTSEEQIPVLGRAADNRRTTRDVRRRIGFHFGASMVLRRMPLQEACALILSFKDQEDTHLILIDATDIRDLNSALVDRWPAKCAATIERWQGSLREFMTCLKTLDKFYAMDSGPAHLAAALGVDTTVFFGPNPSTAVRPRGSNVTVIERRDMPCRPCDERHCTNPRYQACLTDLAQLLGQVQSQDSILAICSSSVPDSGKLDGRRFVKESS